MMKRFTLAAFAIALLTVNVTASAGGDRHGGNGGHGNHSNYGRGNDHGGGPRHGNGHGNGYYGHGNGYNGHGYGGYYAPRYYPYRPHYAYRPYRPYYGYPYYSNNHNNSNSAAYLVGGLVVGSLLTNAYNKSQQNVYSAQQYTQPVQVVAAPQGRRLLRDLNGNCYERTTDGAGNELRTELPASACNR